MITLTDEQALQIEEALVATLKNNDYWLEKCTGALDTIRAARAQEQSEQEPVAWATKISKAFFNSPANGVFQVSHIMRDEYNVPLYTPPVDAKAIRAEALEEAAKVCEEVAKHYITNHKEQEQVWLLAATSDCAAAIRARGETK